MFGHVHQKRSPAEAGRRRKNLFANLYIIANSFAFIGNNLIINSRAFHFRVLEPACSVGCTNAVLATALQCG